MALTVPQRVVVQSSNLEGQPLRCSSFLSVWRCYDAVKWRFRKRGCNESAFYAVWPHNAYLEPFEGRLITHCGDIYGVFLAAYMCRLLWATQVLWIFTGPLWLPHMHLLFEPVVCDVYGTFIEENQQGRTSNLGAVFFVGCSLQDIVNIPLSKYSLCSVITAPWWRLCWYGLFPGDTMHCISGRMYWIS